MYITQNKSRMSRVFSYYLYDTHPKLYEYLKNSMNQFSMFSEVWEMGQDKIVKVILNLFVSDAYDKLIKSKKNDAHAIELKILMES